MTKSTTPPFIRVVNDSGLGHKTQVFYGDTDISSAISEVGLSIKVGEVNRATLTALAVNGEIKAEVVELQQRVIPPPLPCPEWVYSISEPVRHYGRLRSRWRLSSRLPLGDVGTVAETIAQGWCAPIGPLKITQPQ